MQRDINDLIHDIAVKQMELSGLICELAKETNFRGELIEKAAEALKDANKKATPDAPVAPPAPAT